MGLLWGVVKGSVVGWFASYIVPVMAGKKGEQLKAMTSDERMPYVMGGAALGALHEALGTGGVRTVVLSPARRASPGRVPPPGVPFQNPVPGEYASPQKHHFFTLPRAQQDVIRASNDAMRGAVDSLLDAGVQPRWVLETANRFVSQKLGVPSEVHTTWDAFQLSSEPPDREQNWYWDGSRWTTRSQGLPVAAEWW